MTTTIIIWACMAVALAIGWAMGRVSALSRSSAPLPHSSDGYRLGYAAGYEGARQKFLQIAREHDFTMLELRFEQDKPPVQD